MHLVLLSTSYKSSPEHNTTACNLIFQSELHFVFLCTPPWKVAPCLVHVEACLLDTFMAVSASRAGSLPAYVAWRQSQLCEKPLRACLPESCVINSWTLTTLGWGVFTAQFVRAANVTVGRNNRSRNVGGFIAGSRGRSLSHLAHLKFAH